MRQVESEIRKRIEREPGLRELQGQIRFTHTPEGLRIELVDRADYSMFATGTAILDPRAAELLRIVAEVIGPLPQRLAIRGHTDSMPYGPNAGGNNNWTLSTARAEATRQALAEAGVDARRFARLEGVADTEPLFPEDPYDPRNRRLSVTLLRG
jgi:chemotaxis protein MotB